MIIGFESYAPGAWVDLNGLVLSGKSQRAANTKSLIKRKAHWSQIASSSMIVGVCLAVSAAVVTTDASVAIAVASPVGIGDVIGPDPAMASAKDVVALSPIREINRTFNQFFDSVRAGHSLIPSDDIRALVRKAVHSNNAEVDIEAWARNLTNDVKGAKD